MMTTSETVILVTPPKTAAAPTIAYSPGVMQDSSCAHSPRKNQGNVSW